MSNFHTGSRIVVVKHPDGIYSKDGVIRTYYGIVEKIKHNQETREYTDIIRMEKLDEGNYYICIRQRTGPQSEYESVILSEYGVKGRYPVTWESEFIIWNQGMASGTNEFIAAGGFNGEVLC